MRCDHDRLRIALLLDGELPAPEREAFQTLWTDCPDCRRYRDELIWLSGHLRQVRIEPSAAFQERLRTRLDYEAAEMTGEPGPVPAPQSWTAQLLDRIRPFWQDYARQAAALLAVCALSVLATLWWAGQSATRQDLAHDVVAAHVRSLLQDNEVQVASLDTHTVKPWFNGRLDYTPLVKDLASDGFKLAGGRLDYVDGRRVAALVYLVRLHKISLFVWPSDGPQTAPVETKINGYNLLSWSKGGMNFWAISDLDETELAKLPGLL